MFYVISISRQSIIIIIPSYYRDEISVLFLFQRAKEVWLQHICHLIVKNKTIFSFVRHKNCFKITVFLYLLWTKFNSWIIFIFINTRHFLFVKIPWPIICNKLNCVEWKCLSPFCHFSQNLVLIWSNLPQIFSNVKPENLSLQNILSANICDHS